MEYRQLGRSGMRVSTLCLGTMNFGASADESTSTLMVHRSLEAGINFIDTADVYGRGVSEEITGKAIAESGRRDEIVLATKAVAHMGKGPNDHGASRYHLVRACEASLKRLRTDRIDLYQLHIVDLTTPLDEILETLDILVKQGKILYCGTSKWPPTLIMEALGIADRRGLPGERTGLDVPAPGHRHHSLGTAGIRAAHGDVPQGPDAPGRPPILHGRTGSQSLHTPGPGRRGGVPEAG